MSARGVLVLRVVASTFHMLRECNILFRENSSSKVPPRAIGEITEEEDGLLVGELTGKKAQLLSAKIPHFDNRAFGVQSTSS